MIVNGYKIDVVCANIDAETCAYGDIYLDPGKCRAAHPNEDVMYGFYVHPKQEGEDTPDWFGTLYEAIKFAEAPNL